ncbi:MAG TPA: prohibitin family protein [Pseudolabrys sp.]|nr:prohibitin family protein [Pseudolabrys sp.]
MVTYHETLGEMPPAAQPRRWWWRFIGRNLPVVSLTLMVALLVAVVLFPYVVITVPSGMVGVLWKRFNGYDLYCWCFVGRGTILDPRELRDEGLHLIWPWDKLFLYNLRLQNSTQTYNAISKDGVNVAVQVSIRYQLLHDHVPVLHKFIGPDYLDSVVGPEIGSQTREVISQYTAQEVYRSREEIQAKIRNSSQKSLGAHLNSLVQPEAMEQPDPKHYNDFLQNSIQILDTPVLSIELPPPIVAAINRQTQQYYEIQEFKYRVQREAEESRRKQIEANGIAAFQRTVSQGISDSYLRWRGIEATLALAQSPNTKIVIIGSGKDGLPIILGNVDNPSAPSLKLKAPDEQSAPPQSPPPGTTGKLPANNSTTSEVIPPDGTVAGASKTQPDAPPPAPAVAEKPPNASARPSLNIPLDVSDLDAILSRISQGLHPNKSATGQATDGKPK